MSSNHSFESVAPRGRLVDTVADQIEKLIVEGQMEPGTKLPSEAELGQEFNVSRTVIREAVNSLIAKGLVQTRHGIGTTVRPFNRDLIVSSLSRFLHSQDEGVSLQELHQVRTILELSTARLAAVHATEEDIADLELLQQEMETLHHDYEAFAAKDADFHRRLAMATHNRLLVLLLDSIRDLMQDYILSTLPHVDISREVVPRHRRIVERLADRDAEGARRAMWEHHTAAPWEKYLDQELGSVDI